MNWLLLDSACPRAVAALSVGGAVVASRYLSETKQHSEQLSPAVREMLSEQGLSMDDVNGVIVGKGPGSFIGVRVAMAYAKGLCTALHVPLVGVGTLSAFVHEPSLPKGQGAAIIDARRGEFYVQHFERDEKSTHLVGSPALMPTEGLDALLAKSSAVIGTWPALERFMPGPSAEGLWLAFLSASEGGAGVHDELHTLLPDYVRDPDAKPTFASTSKTRL